MDVFVHKWWGEYFKTINKQLWFLFKNCDISQGTQNPVFHFSEKMRTDGKIWPSFPNPNIQLELRHLATAPRTVYYYNQLTLLSCINYLAPKVTSVWDPYLRFPQKTTSLGDPAVIPQLRQGPSAPGWAGAWGASGPHFPQPPAFHPADI